MAARIRCFYGRKAHVVYPPVDAGWIRDAPNWPENLQKTDAAFLYAGALVPYKRVDLVIKACAALGLPLWVVGKGPEEKKLKEMAGPTVRFFGYVNDRELASFYKACRALIFPVKEDFGIVPLECLAAGRPVVGLDDGACRETLNGLKKWDPVWNASTDRAILSGVSIRKRGSLLEELKESLRYFIENEAIFNSEACRKQAARFSRERFYEGWRAISCLTT